MAQFTISIRDNEIILNPSKPHLYTLVWIHGLSETPSSHLRYLLTTPLLNALENFRVVIPQAPERKVTVINGQLTTSWFDIKFRSQKSFLVDFDEAFSSAEVHDSYQRILLPILIRENQIIKGEPKRIFVGGFSQGCGMAMHCFYTTTKIQFAGVLGVAGYFFPLTNFDKQNRTIKRLIYGTQDEVRPWQYVKVTYVDKLDEKEIVFIEGMKHELKRQETINQMARFFTEATSQLKQQ